MLSDGLGFLTANQPMKRLPKMCAATFGQSKLRQLMIGALLCLATLAVSAELLKVKEDGFRTVVAVGGGCKDAGTGIVLDTMHVLTAHHVVSNCAEGAEVNLKLVKQKDGRISFSDDWAAQLIAEDLYHDLALLRLSAKRFPGPQLAMCRQRNFNPGDTAGVLALPLVPQPSGEDIIEFHPIKTTFAYSNENKIPQIRLTDGVPGSSSGGAILDAKDRVVGVLIQGSVYETHGATLDDATELLGNNLALQLPACSEPSDTFNIVQNSLSGFANYVSAGADSLTLSFCTNSQWLEQCKRKVKADLNRRDAEAHYAAGEMEYHGRKDYRKVLTHLDSALKASPDCVSALHLKAWIVFETNRVSNWNTLQSKFNWSIKLLTRALALTKKTEVPVCPIKAESAEGQILNTRSFIYSDAAEKVPSGSNVVRTALFERSLSDADEAVKIAPTDAFAHKQKSWIHYQKAQALSDVTDGVESNPTEAKLQYQNAIRSISEALKLQPKNFGFFQLRGNYYFDFRLHQSAENHLYQSAANDLSYVVKSLTGQCLTPRSSSVSVENRSPVGKGWQCPAEHLLNLVIAQFTLAIVKEASIPDDHAKFEEQHPLLLSAWEMSKPEFVSRDFPGVVRDKVGRRRSDIANQLCWIAADDSVATPTELAKYEAYCRFAVNDMRHRVAAIPGILRDRRLLADSLDSKATLLLRLRRFQEAEIDFAKSCEIEDRPKKFAHCQFGQGYSMFLQGKREQGRAIMNRSVEGGGGTQVKQQFRKFGLGGLAA